MIPITKEIIGPGIEEEYDDALPRIKGLLQILKPFPVNNSTPEGHVKYELEWLKQEIEESHVSFPVERRLISIFCYVIGEGSLDRLPNFQSLSHELYTILLDGLVKPRHYPVVAAMIDDAIQLIPKSSITPEMQAAVDELENVRGGLVDSHIKLPLRKEDWPAFAQIRWSTRLGITFPTVQAMFAIYYALFTGGRPDLCDKGPLPAPRKGLRSRR